MDAKKKRNVLIVSAVAGSWMLLLLFAFIIHDISQPIPANGTNSSSKMATNFEVMTPIEFKVNRVTNPVPFRAIVKLQTYYNYEFIKADKIYYSYYIQFPESDQVINGYILRHSEDGKALFSLTKDGCEHNVSIVLRFLPSSECDNICAIDSLISTDWKPSKEKVIESCQLMDFKDKDDEYSHLFWDGVMQTRTRKDWANAILTDIAIEAKDKGIPLYKMLIIDANKQLSGMRPFSGLDADNFIWFQIANHEGKKP